MKTQCLTFPNVYLLMTPIQNSIALLEYVNISKIWTIDVLVKARCRQQVVVDMLVVDTRTFQIRTYRTFRNRSFHSQWSKFIAFIAWVNLKFIVEHLVLYENLWNFFLPKFEHLYLLFIVRWNRIFFRTYEQCSLSSWMLNSLMLKQAKISTTDIQNKSSDTNRKFRFQMFRRFCTFKFSKTVTLR